MTEAMLQAEVLAMCERRGLKTVTIGDSIRVTPGWVDVLVLGRGCLAIELKSADGRRTMAQIDMAQHLDRARIPYRLWRPEHLVGGTITTDLDGLT